MYFYYFSHMLQAWILPPGVNLLLAIVGFLWLRYSKRVGQCIVIVAFVSLWLFCTPMIARLLINHLQSAYPTLKVDQIPRKPLNVIIVLGGGHTISPEYENGYVLSDATEERLHYAAYLYHQTHFPIIVSGGTFHASSPSEAELMRQDLKNYYFIFDAWKEDKSINTRDEGKLMVPILKKHGIKTAYLVTNAWHMPRAMYAFHYSFRNTKINIIAAPMGYLLLQSDQEMLSYLPSFEALDVSATAMHEYIGFLAYRLINFI